MDAGETSCWRRSKLNCAMLGCRSKNFYRFLPANATTDAPTPEMEIYRAFANFSSCIFGGTQFMLLPEHVITCINTILMLVEVCLTSLKPFNRVTPLYVEFFFSPLFPLLPLTYVASTSTGCRRWDAAVWVWLDQHSKRQWVRTPTPCIILTLCSALFAEPKRT